MQVNLTRLEAELAYAHAVWISCTACKSRCRTPPRAVVRIVVMSRTSALLKLRGAAHWNYTILHLSVRRSPIVMFRLDDIPITMIVVDFALIVDIASA